MSNQGTVEFQCPVLLAAFIAKIVETSSAVFSVEQTHDHVWIVTFGGGY